MSVLKTEISKQQVETDVKIQSLGHACDLVCCPGQGIWDLDQSDDRDEDDSVLILGELFEAQQDWTTAGSLFGIRDFP